MRNVLGSITLAAALIAAPIALHADTLMTGQFAIQGTVQNVGSTLDFSPGTLSSGSGTQTGSFLALVPDLAPFTAGNPTVAYNPYTPGSDFFNVGSLTTTVQSLTAVPETIGLQNFLVFSGVADLSATGFLDTLANFTFTIPASGAAAFSATIITQAAPGLVPEPSSLALFGSGALGLASFTVRKFRRPRV
jgi:hypothetical protein